AKGRRIPLLARSGLGSAGRLDVAGADATQRGAVAQACREGVEMGGGGDDLRVAFDEMEEEVTAAVVQLGQRLVEQEDRFLAGAIRHVAQLAETEGQRDAALLATAA